MGINAETQIRQDCVVMLKHIYFNISACMYSNSGGPEKGEFVAVFMLIHERGNGSKIVCLLACLTNHVERISDFISR